MGYVEKIMGDSEQVVYQTHRHAIVLFQRTIGWLFAFLIFLALGLAMFFLKDDQDRFVIGLIALGTLVLPVYTAVAAWVRGSRGRDFLKKLWQPAVAAILILIVAVVIMLNPTARPLGWVAVALSLIPLAKVIQVFLDWLNERYLITNRRVMEVKGIINKQISDSALEKVNDVKMRQSVVGRLLRYGTVEIITGSDIGLNLFHRISNPVLFKRAMLNAKEQLHASVPQKPETGIPAGAQPPDAGADIPDLIAELDELRRKGVLSEEEFQAKKKELLARL